METKHSRCLVLNADYTPLTIIGWQKALLWSIKHEYDVRIGVEIIDFYKDDFICGVNKKYPIPAVVKTAKYFRVNNYKVKFSRKNLFIRDNYTCQYCNNRFDINSLTYDHVVPKSVWDHNKGSPTSWTNIVTACRDCNRRKGNRTPKQANMPLQNLPNKPQKNVKYLPITTYLSKIRSEIPTEWIGYLPESYL
ncbi:MAG: HNH endonuclease [Chitinophagia bacterium]|nr:HNH endonuclease [Chitinophagia bacterium]